MGERKKERIAPNLYLVTRASGNQFYTVRFMQDGKAVERSLGNVLDMSLRQAKAQAGRVILEIETAPKEKKQQIPLFKDCYLDAIKDIERVKQWRNPKSSFQWHSSITNDALPVLGNIRVDAVTRDDVLAVLRPIWLTKSESAKRLQQRLSAVFDWCMVKGFCQSNPAQWRSNLAFFLPAASKVIKRQHHDAPSVDEVKKVVRWCIAHPSPVNGLLLLTIATVSRISEVRQASAGQINGDVWTVPETAQKVAKADRRIPLSELAMLALTMAQPSGYLFQGMQGGMVCVDAARLKMMKVLGRKTTAHGIRSTFRDWCSRNSIDRDIAERCLSHVVGSDTERAYLRDDFFTQRKAVLDRWSRELLNKS